MLTGPITIFSLPDNDTLVDECHNQTHTTGRYHRQIETQEKWREDASVYVTMDQIPYGIPTEYEAVGSDWIISGRLSGSVPIWGGIVNAQYIARNSRWVNYLGYNQQRFINWTIEAFDKVSEQLHATSLINMQNRLLIETMLADKQGVCDLIGDNRCTIIPMHTGEEGDSGTGTGKYEENER